LREHRGHKTSNCWLVSRVGVRGGRVRGEKRRRGGGGEFIQFRDTYSPCHYYYYYYYYYYYCSTIYYHYHCW